VIEQAEGNFSAYSPDLSGCAATDSPVVATVEGRSLRRADRSCGQLQDEAQHLPSGSGTPHSNRQAFVARRTSEPSHQT